MMADQGDTLVFESSIVDILERARRDCTDIEKDELIGCFYRVARSAFEETYEIIDERELFGAGFLFPHGHRIKS